MRAATEALQEAEKMKQDRQGDLDTATQKSHHYFEMLKERLEPAKTEEEADDGMEAEAASAKDVLDSVEGLTKLLAASNTPKLEGEAAQASLAEQFAQLNTHIAALREANLRSGDQRSRKAARKA